MEAQQAAKRSYQLSDDELNIIGAALGELPHRVSNPLIVSLTQQFQVHQAEGSAAPQGPNVEEIARVAHEINRAYCEGLGDTSQVAWESAPAWQRESAINGVKFHIANPDAGPEHSHNEWLKEKEATGWKYGPVKDVEKKEHPCFVPYGNLPVEQRVKDFLFRAVVHALGVKK